MPSSRPISQGTTKQPHRLVVNFHAKHSSEGTKPNAHSADQTNTNVNNGNKQAVGFAGFNRNAQGLTHRIASQGLTHRIAAQGLTHRIVVGFRRRRHLLRGRPASSVAASPPPGS